MVADNRETISYFVRFFGASEQLTREMDALIGRDRMECRVNRKGVSVHSFEITSMADSDLAIELLERRGCYEDFDVFISLRPLYGTEIIDMEEYILRIIRIDGSRPQISYTNYP